MSVTADAVAEPRRRTCRGTVRLTFGWRFDGYSRSMPHARDPLYRRHRFPAEVIGYAVWLYFRFPLSLRMVEEMLAARGIIVSSGILQSHSSRRAGSWRQMASRRGRHHDRRQETLALARRRSGWLRSRHPRPKPERSRRRAAAHAEAVEEVHESATRHDHRQAQILWRSAQAHGPLYRTSPAQGAEQSSGEFSSADAATRKNHEAVQITTAGAEISVDTRSSRQSFPFSPQSTFRRRSSRCACPSLCDLGQDHKQPTRHMTPADFDRRFVARMIPLT